MACFSLFESKNCIYILSTTKDLEVGTREKEIKQIIEGIYELLGEEIGDNDFNNFYSSNIQYVEEFHKEVPCSLVTLFIKRIT